MFCPRRRPAGRPRRAFKPGALRPFVTTVGTSRLYRSHAERSSLYTRGADTVVPSWTGEITVLNRLVYFKDENLAGERRDAPSWGLAFVRQEKLVISGEVKVLAWVAQKELGP